MRLFLCEKPSQGKTLARLLGAVEPGSGCYTGSNVIVTWCIGHLLEAAPPERYGTEFKRWSLKHLPIIPDPWRVEVKPAHAVQFRIVKRLLEGAAEVIIATDADREGEMIAREVLETCGYRGPIQRLWLSALNDASIRRALGALKPGHETLPLYHAALARSRADWLVGMNLTRLFTLLGQQAGLHALLPVGRVQTPTLQLVVDRDREIAAFVPVPYWAIEVQLSAAGEKFRAEWIASSAATDSAGRCLNEALAQDAAERLRGAELAQVTSVETERIREPPPLPYDLSTLQEVCSRQLGFDVKDTLDLAQTLYERHKAITYPRTDSGYLPESMLAEVPTVLDALIATDPGIRPLIETLERTRCSRTWNDDKVGAHHGIIPTTEPAQRPRMSSRERPVYELIRARYLAQFLPDHEYDRTVAQLTCADLDLQARGQRMLVAGWRSAVDSARAPDGEDTEAPQSARLPPLRSAMSCAVAAVTVHARKTQPPKPYTQGELVKAMKGVARFVTDPRLKQTLKDTAGIGTEATRADIIRGLLRRGYLEKAGRGVRASDMAVSLIDALPVAIRDPGTTAVWEEALERIASGDLSLEEFVAKNSAWVAELVRTYAATPLILHRAGELSPPVKARRSRRRR